MYNVFIQNVQLAGKFQLNEEIFTEKISKNNIYFFKYY